MEFLKTPVQLYGFHDQVKEDERRVQQREEALGEV